MNTMVAVGLLLIKHGLYIQLVGLVGLCSIVCIIIVLSIKYYILCIACTHKIINVNVLFYSQH